MYLRHLPLPAVRRTAAAAVGLLTAALLATAVTPSASLADPGAPERAAAPAARRAVPDTFRLATFNILGSQHTQGSKRWKAGTVRARITSQIIDTRGLDVVGMQEVQSDQLAVLQKKLTGYQIWPGTELGNSGERLQIAFRTSKFQLVETGTITTAFDRQRRPVPWVLLRSVASDQLFYVVDVHNSPRGLEKERDQATRHEIRLIEELRATGRAVLVVGDANEKEEWFCKVTGRTDLLAANGGTATSPQDCQPPPGYLPIDWLMGGGPMTFSDYGWDEDVQVRKASDHRLVRTSVTLPAALPVVATTP